MSIVSIKAGIVEMLNANLVVNPDNEDTLGFPLKKVYNYGLDLDNMAIKNYPICVVLPSSNENDYLSTSDNLRGFPFEIWVVARCAFKSLKTVQNEIETAIDSIMDLFDKNEFNSIDDIADWSSPTVGNFTTRNVSSGNVEVAAYVVLKCNKIKDIQ